MSSKRLPIKVLKSFEQRFRQEGGLAGFDGWLSARRGPLHPDDLRVLLANTACRGATHSFLTLWALFQEGGGTVQQLCRARCLSDPPNEPHYNPHWQENLMHRAISSFVADDRPGVCARLDGHRVSHLEALMSTGMPVATDISTKTGKNVLHTLLFTATFHFHSANPPTGLRQDALAVGLRLREAGVDIDHTAHDIGSARDLARKNLPELAQAWAAQDQANVLIQALAEATARQPGRRRF